MKDKPYVTAIILAAGNGSRMGKMITKQRMILCGESVLHRSVNAFASCTEIDFIVVACKADEEDWVREELSDITKPISVIIGGKSRAESATKAFVAIPHQTEFVAIHDGARCLVTEEIIEKVVGSAYNHGAATAGVSVSDTVKLVEDNFINSTIARESLFLAQTPQVFSCDLYRKALDSCSSELSITDDNMIVEKVGGKIYCVDTGKQNIKITTEEDLVYAEYILNRRKAMSEFRVGHGYDVHRLVKGRRLILGGVEIPCEIGLLGHSDADVLTHAIMDALLGSCGLGDIGRHFPDSSEDYKDISSLHLLLRVARLIKENGFTVVNIDATLVLQKPKIAPYVNEMVENISEILGIDKGRINIKATTEEGLGISGREEGACAYAVATVKK